MKILKRKDLTESIYVKLQCPNCKKVQVVIHIKKNEEPTPAGCCENYIEII